MKKLLLPSATLILSFSAHSQGLWQANGSNIVHTSRLVGINTSNPSQQLEVNGSIKMTDGNQGAGKLFTSDAGGVGSWQTPIWIIDNNIIVNNYDTRDMQVFGTFMPLGFPNIAGNGTSLDIAGDKTNINQARINFDPANGVLNFYAGTPAGNPPSMAIDNGQIRINGNPLQQSQWSTNPDSSLSFNGNVFVKNLNASESINIGTFRFSNGGANPLPVIIDSIRTPFPMTISSGANQIRLDADTLRLGDRVAIDPSPIAGNVRLSVQGDVTASGKITANCVNTSCLNVSGNTQFDSVRISTKLKIGTESLILENDPGGFFNSIYTTPNPSFPGIKDLFIQNNASFSHNTIINPNNSGKVGIGTFAPVEKLHVVGKGLFEDGSGNGVTIGFNSVNSLIDSKGMGALLINYHNNNPVVIGSGSPTSTLKIDGVVGIGTNPDPSHRLLINHDDSDPNGGIAINRQSPTNSAKSEIKFNQNGIQKWAIGNDLNNNGQQTFFIWDHSAGATRFLIDPNGKVFIGNFTYPCASCNSALYKLYVDGGIAARDVKVTQTSFPDYVFANEYELMPIKELELFIQQYKHLPDIPSAAEIKKNDGFEVGDMQTKLLKKIEELSLYMIGMNNNIEQLQKENTSLKLQVEKLEKK